MRRRKPILRSRVRRQRNELHEVSTNPSHENGPHTPHRPAARAAGRAARCRNAKAQHHPRDAGRRRLRRLRVSGESDRPIPVPAAMPPATGTSIRRSSTTASLKRPPATAPTCFSTRRSNEWTKNVQQKSHSLPTSRSMRRMDRMSCRRSITSTKSANLASAKTPRSFLE